MPRVPTPPDQPSFYPARLPELLEENSMRSLKYTIPRKHDAVDGISKNQKGKIKEEKKKTQSVCFVLLMHAIQSHEGIHQLSRSLNKNFSCQQQCQRQNLSGLIQPGAFLTCVCTGKALVGEILSGVRNACSRCILLSAGDSCMEPSC